MMGLFWPSTKKCVLCGETKKCCNTSYNKYTYGYEACEECAQLITLADENEINLIDLLVLNAEKMPKNKFIRRRDIILKNKDKIFKQFEKEDDEQIEAFVRSIS